MQRKQVSDIGTIPFQPVARPTDQFAAPEVRNSGNGTEFLQLSQALNSIDPTIQGIIKHRADAFELAREAKAPSIAAQYENVAAFRKAVDEGKIDEADTPWYRVLIEQNISKHEAETARNLIWDKYQQDQSVQQKDPQQFVDWVKGEFGGVLAGRSQWELQVMQPTIQQSQDEFLKAHLNQQRATREATMQNSQMVGVQDDLSLLPPGTVQEAAGGNVEAQQLLDSVVQSIQNRVTEAEKVVHPLRVGKWASDAIIQAGLQTNDSDMFKTVLNRVKMSDGNTLNDLFDTRETSNKVAEHIDAERDRLSTTEWVREQRQEAADNKKVSNLFWGKYQEDRKTNPKASPLDTVVPVSDLPPSVQATLDTLRLQAQHSRDAIDGEKLKSLSSDFQARLLANQDISKTEEVSLINALTLGGQGPLAEKLKAAYEDREGFGTLDPSVIKDFSLKLADKTLTVDMVVDKMKSTGSMDVFNRWVEAARTVDRPQAGRPLEWYTKTLESMITESYMGSDILSDREPLKNAEAAIADFTDQRFKLLEDRRELALPANAAELNEATAALMDEASRKVGGPSYNDWQTSRREKANKPAVVKAPAIPPADPLTEKYVAPLAVQDKIIAAALPDNLKLAQVVMQAYPEEWSYGKWWSGASAIGYEYNPKPARYEQGQVVPGDALGVLMDGEFSAKFYTGSMAEKYDKDFVRDWTAARDRYWKLSEDMHSGQTVEKFSALMDQYQEQKMAGRLRVKTAQEQRLVRGMLNQMLEHSMLSRVVPPRLDEVKTLPPEQQSKLRLFANQLDLSDRGQKVFEYLGGVAVDETGKPTPGFTAFKKAQMTLLPYKR